MKNETQFHLAKNGQEIGVFEEKEIKKAYSDGQIDGEVLVWREGMEGWVTIFEVFPQWKPTEAQIQFLTDCRIEISGNLTKLEASRLLEKRPPSNYELRILEKMGVRGISQMTGEEAKARIEEFSEQKPEKLEKIREEVRAEEARRKYEMMIQNMPVALKNEILEMEGELGDEAKELENLKEEIKKTEKELAELQKQKPQDQDEADEIACQISDLKESIKDQKKEIEEQVKMLPEARKEQQEARREVAKGRIVFWETTFLGDSPRITDDAEEWIASQEGNWKFGQQSPPSSFPPAVAFGTPISRKLYSDYGYHFNKPQRAQVAKILKALDEVDMRWEEKDLSLFYQTLESWFPEMKK